MTMSCSAGTLPAKNIQTLKRKCQNQKFWGQIFDIPFSPVHWVGYNTLEEKYKAAVKVNWSLLTRREIFPESLMPPKRSSSNMWIQEPWITNATNLENGWHLYKKSAGYGRNIWSSRILKDIRVGSVLNLSVTILKVSTYTETLTTQPQRNARYSWRHGRKNQNIFVTIRIKFHPVHTMQIKQVFYIESFRTVCTSIKGEKKQFDVMKQMKDKMRIAAMVCTAEDGWRAPIAWIGKSKNPRCFNFPESHIAATTVT